MHLIMVVYVYVYVCEYACVFCFFVCVCVCMYMSVCVRVRACVVRAYIFRIYIWSRSSHLVICSSLVVRMSIFYYRDS